jgi:hypothetical protein
MTRESHDADLAPGQRPNVQHRFGYSDGFGRQLQQKALAEPGPVPARDANAAIIVGPDGQPVMTASAATRWVAGGWTIVNNKGKAVRQFEPFFTDTHAFEADVRIGVGPVLFYDPFGRLVASVHPDHSWRKVVFTPWRQDAWDGNDTAGMVDPRSDPDAGGYFARLPERDYLPVWSAQRAGGALGPSSALATTAFSGLARPR